MKACITVLLLFVLTVASNAQKLDGKWKGKVDTPNGEMNLQYTFKVAGDTLTGNVTSDYGELPLNHGKVNGKEFSFDIDVNGQTFSTTGVLEGDTAKLTAPMMEHPMVLTRVTEGTEAAKPEVAKSGAAKIDGKWLGKVEGPQGEMELTFNFKVDGNKLTGTNSSPMGSLDITNGVVNGDDFSFDIDMQGMKITHKCKYLPDDSIEVKVNVMDQDVVMKLARAAN